MVGGVKDKIVSLFKTNATKDYGKPTHIKKNVWWWKETKETKNKRLSVDNIIKNIRNIFRLKNKRK